MAVVSAGWVWKLLRTV